MIITFLTDFGLQDDFVGTCHGVIAIGPQTATEVEAQGLTLRSVAKSHDLEGILDEIRAL